MPSLAPNNSPTDCLAGFITEISFADLPSDVVRKAKLWLLDAIGCGLGGSTTALPRTAVDALSQISSGNARVLGRGVEVSPGTSAFLNAMSINALDYDDADPSGHPSSTIVGTLLALSCQQKMSGRDFLLSYIVGFEISSRIGQAIAPSVQRFAEVWGLGTHQTFGAVAAASKCMNLTKSQTLDAMGIAGASAPVPSAQKWGWDNRPLAWMKDAVAFPAQIGVVSATLARAGFAGCRDILDGPTGFWRMAASDQCNFEMMTRELGSEYFIRQGSIKTWSCCWFIHPTLNAIQTVMKEKGLTHTDIEQVDVWSLTDLSELFADIRPAQMVDAQFSLPYCIAMLLLGVPTGPAWFDADLFDNEQVLSIGARVRIHPDPGADEIFHQQDRRIRARIAITTRGGDTYEASEPAPRGSPANPIGDEEIIDKFLSMAIPVLGAQKSSELQQCVLNLESSDEADVLPTLFSVPSTL